MQTADLEAAEKLNPAASNSPPPSTSSNSFVRFFVSLWTRIKLLFTSAISDVCECTLSSKSLSRSRNASVSVPFKEDTTEGDLGNFVKLETQKPVELETPAHYCQNNNVVCETYCNEVQPVNFNVLPEFCTPPQEMSDSIIIFDNEEEIIAELPVESYPYQDDLMTSVISQQTVLVDESSESIISQAKVARIEHSIINFVNDESDAEFQYSPEQSLYSSTNVVNDNQPSALTVLGRLYTQLMNGEISEEEKNDVSKKVLLSTLPRNLSNCSECSPPLKPGQLYSWERVNSSGLDLEVEEPTKYVMDPESFVDCLISDALELFADSSLTKAQHLVIEEDLLEVPHPIAHFMLKMKNNSTEPSHQFLLTADYPSIPIDSPLSDSALGETLNSRNQCDSHKVSTSSMDSYLMRSNRSSSLKSDHSPCSPSRKIVRFADALGLDLESVRQVLDADNPPKIPASATVDLNLDVEKSLGSIGAKQFQICFPQPGASGNFHHNVLQLAVCLENARIDSPRGVLTGTIRVKSLGFEKRVCVRITYNNWATFCEIPASYIMDSFDGVTDRFSFCAVFPPAMVVGDKAQFAIRYEVLNSGEIFWDSNHGENYVITCYAKATDMAGDGSWLHFV